MSTTPIPRWKKNWIKYSRFEYWPVNVFYFPVVIYSIALAIRYRKAAYFTAANPAMEYGGMAGAKKTDIYKILPAAYIPKTILIAKGDFAAAKSAAIQIGFPVVCKPNIGERGAFVELIKNEKQLQLYSQKCPVDFIVQEMIDLPEEFGIFYSRHPDEPKGHITSLTQKGFMSVTGDGEKTVYELLQQNVRAQIVLDFDHPRFAEIMDTIPDKGQTLRVENIGNHCRGTIFLDKTSLIDEELSEAIDRLAKSIEGFHYGRFDIRCTSLEDLKQLKNFKIIELNGTASEPAHIYQPGYSLAKAYKTVFWHFSRMGKISYANMKAGYNDWPFAKAWKKYGEIRAHDRIIRPKI